MVNFSKHLSDFNRNNSLAIFNLDLDSHPDFANNKDYTSINNIVRTHLVNIMDVVNLKGFMSLNRYTSLNRSIKQSVKTYELNKTIIERLKNELKSDFFVNDMEIKNLEKLNLLVKEEIEDSIGSFKDRLIEDTRKCMNEILTETTRISEEAMEDLNRVKKALLEDDLGIDLDKEEIKDCEFPTEDCEVEVPDVNECEDNGDKENTECNDEEDLDDKCEDISET